MAAIVTFLRCPYCQRFRSPLDLIALPGGASICTSCQQRHLEALELLSTGKWTGECSECGKTADPGHPDPLAVHYENGRYRAVCMACDPSYTRKRRELYGNTEFGNTLKL